MQQNFSNLVAAIVLSTAIIFGWNYFFPQYRKIEHPPVSSSENIAKETKLNTELTRSQAISSTNRVGIKSEFIQASISLKGLRFDDLILSKYKSDLSEDSPAVEMFSPSNTKEAYFAELGWWGEEEGITYPDANTIWTADKEQISNNEKVNFSWTNPQGVIFKVSLELDSQYMFTIIQYVENKSAKAFKFRSYGLINRNYAGSAGSAMNILHQGMIGAANNELKEYTYSKIKDDKKESFSGAVHWIGITDKYWLAAFIPDAKEKYNAKYNFAVMGNQERYQADFLGEERIVAPGENYSCTQHLFVGPKKVDLLDKYESELNIALFDHAIDFGWFYVLTKPIFNAMNFFYKYVGNFGISIMIVTVIIKLLMFTLANKSYRSMKKMKKLQPELELIKSRYENDKMRLQQEIMALYKKEKVNPVSGCLPLLIQIPVFFSIYKVLYVTIEMRHAPFFGWIQDLSAPDPTSIFNLFGLLPFTPPSFLMIGVWPIFMAITMFLQQKMSPQPADPVQAQVMKMMPLMFLFMFSGFPAGLLIYWSWNNILSIIQQLYINKMDKE